jgi:hypothetical protein
MDSASPHPSLLCFTCIDHLCLCIKFALMALAVLHFNPFSIYFAGPNNFIETLRERMFRPSLSTIISENSK